MKVGSTRFWILFGILSIMSITGAYLTDREEDVSTSHGITDSDREWFYELEDKTTVQGELGPFELYEVTITSESSTKISMYIPVSFQNLNSDMVVDQIGFFGKYSSNEFSSLSVEEIQTELSFKFTASELFSTLVEGVKEDSSKFTEEILRTLPKTIYENYQLHTADVIRVRDKPFVRRIGYFVDGRFRDTDYEDVLITEFYYCTYHNSRKYEFHLLCGSNQKGIADVKGFYETVLGTIQFM